MTTITTKIAAPGQIPGAQCPSPQSQSVGSKGSVIAGGARHVAVEPPGVIHPSTLRLARRPEAASPDQLHVLMILSPDPIGGVRAFRDVQLRLVRPRRRSCRPRRGRAERALKADG
jgi:hypothetical protein